MSKNLGGYSIPVLCDLAKVEKRVQFPLPAPEFSHPKSPCGKQGLFGILKMQEFIAHSPSTHGEITHE